MSTHLRVLVLAGLLTLALAAPALAAEITLTDDGFEPDEVTVPAGQTVTWVNATNDVQTVVAADGSWDSGPLQAGERFSVALREEGTVAYETADGDVAGEVEVAADASEGEDTDEAQPVSTGTMPTTGIPALTLLGAGLVLLGGGSLLVRRF